MIQFFISIFSVIILFTSASYAACVSPSGNAGDIVFNPDYHVVQFCNGTTWMAMAQPVAFTANTGCTSPAGVAGEMLYDPTRQVVRFCNGEQWIAVGDSSSYACSGNSGCTSPSGNEGEMLYDSTNGEMRYCNGHAWIGMRGFSGGCRKGYFVLTGTDFSPNLGGRSGANALCLTDLTNNNFMGKSEATLDASHVFAFLCDDTTCNNLQASTQYYFATTGNAAYGGDYFTTDASGIGPGNTQGWDFDTKFGSTGLNGAWSNRGVGANLAWNSGPAASSAACTNWSQTTSGNGRDTDFIGTIGTRRWANTNVLCASGATRRLICYVNP